ncbi:hypothetical protein TWF481_007150 [Arthrobotrys musiformis]|uniref:Uncharacterized protein n=1 Tax=Arthrobotrys musiformis TaxID=47236 RepID=A0AAV9WC81_9PEZI
MRSNRRRITRWWREKPRANQLGETGRKKEIQQVEGGRGEGEERRDREDEDDDDGGGEYEEEEDEEKVRMRIRMRARARARARMRVKTMGSMEDGWVDAVMRRACGRMAGTKRDCWLDLLFSLCGADGAEILPASNVPCC